MAPPTLTLRARISSPLEAGPSIADCHQLPAHVNGALEYVSKRLGRKSISITLIVVSRDYQLPRSPITSPVFTPGGFTPGSLPVSAVTTPLRSVFPLPTQPHQPSKLDALKQLWSSHNNSVESPIRERILHVHHLQRDGTASPAFSEASSTNSWSTYSSVFSTTDSTFSQNNRFRWPGSPTASASVPLTPATPFTVMSSSTDSSFQQSISKFGIKLIYSQSLEPKEEKILNQSLEKAAKKFRLGPDWMPQAVPASTLSLPTDLIRKSLLSNETLFSSTNLTLVSLDQLYNFRTALQAYSRQKVSFRLEDAVDELRRLFLANGRRALRKSLLLSSYRWLDPVSEGALGDVLLMYERGYGERGVVNDVEGGGGWPLVGGRVDDDEEEDNFIDPEKLSVTYIDAGSLIKEMMVSNEEEEEEEEDIEAWYREVSQQPATTTTTTISIPIDPLRSHPPVVEIPSSTPPLPPAPTVIIQQQPITIHKPKPVSQSPQPEIPNSSPPKLLRPLALKLQTSFPSKPTTKPNNNNTLSIPEPKSHFSPITPTASGGEEEDEDPETARPLSAVRTQLPILTLPTLVIPQTNNGGNMRYKTGSIMTINQMLHGDNNSRINSFLSSSTEGEGERVGPMTPNGYDDISPITRGEWGFLMVSKGKKGGVGTVC